MCDLIKKEIISSKIMSHFVLQGFTQNLEDFGKKVLLRTIKIKHPKNLQKSLHLKYYIITQYNKFHPHIVNILFVIELQNNFLFDVSKFIKKD
jgi:hypothetical protein